MTTQLQGKCISISLEHTNREQPFILSAWQSPSGEVRWWTTYLVGAKCVPRAEAFLKDLGWEKPVTGEPLSADEQKELAKFLETARPSGTWPMIPGSTFQIHAAVTERIAFEHGTNGRIPVWAEVGSAALAHMNRMAKAPAPATALPTPDPAPAANSNEPVSQEPTKEPAANVSATGRRGKLRIEHVEPAENAKATTTATAPVPAPHPGVPSPAPAPAAPSTTNGVAKAVPQEAKKVAATAPKVQGPAPTVPATEGAPKTAPQEQGKAQLVKQIAELKRALAEKEAENEQFMKTVKICLRKSDNTDRLVAEAEASGARIGTQFATTILDLWVRIQAPTTTTHSQDNDTDTHRQSLIAAGQEAIEKFDALKFVMTLRELGDRPKPSPSKSMEADSEMDYEV